MADLEHLVALIEMMEASQEWMEAKMNVNQEKLAAEIEANQEKMEVKMDIAINMIQERI
jgi:hypothetical protein